MQAPSAPAVRRVPNTSSLEHSKNILPFRSFTCVQSKDGSFQEADFGISLPVPSADALPATLYGHSTWRPPSRAER